MKYLKLFIQGKYKKCNKVYYTDLYDSVNDLDRIYYRYKIELKLKLFLYNIYKRNFLSEQEKMYRDYKISSIFNYEDRNKGSSTSTIVYKPVCDWCHKEFNKNEIRITTEIKQYHKHCFIKNVKKILNEPPYKNLIIDVRDYNFRSINLIDV